MYIIQESGSLLASRGTTRFERQRHSNDNGLRGYRVHPAMRLWGLSLYMGWQVTVLFISHKVVGKIYSYLTGAS